jgi:HSP20 family protein
MFKRKKTKEKKDTENIFENNIPSADLKLTGKKKSKKMKTEEIPVEEKKNWIEEDIEEGELLVDVYQSNNSIVIRSTIAGVKPEDIDIDINNDMITIRGRRKEELVAEEEDYFYKECYWGGFSRSIILPCEVQANRVKASLKNGVLTVTLPKVMSKKAVKISVDVK